MKRAIVLVLALVLLSANSSAFAFVDQIASFPGNPRAGEPITISFRAGVCEGVNMPVVWDLRGTGNVRDLVVDGAAFLDPLFCLNEIGTTEIVIGALSPGAYEIHIKIRDPLDGAGGIPTPSFGSAQFTVGQARPIPTLNLLGLGIVVVLLVGVVAFGRRRMVSSLSITALALCVMQSPTCVAQEAILLEITLAQAPAPSPESIVEGYDFASGINPPFPALTAGSPSYAVYLLPFRARGEVSARLLAHPESTRAKAERTLLIAYTSPANRDAGIAAMQAEEAIESVSIPVALEHSADEPIRLASAKSILGIPDWRSQLHLPQAWARVGGWARIGVLDNGYDVGHPDLLSFDGSGQYTGGNLITADSLDIGRLGTAPSVDNCVFPAPSTCDTNLDEMEPVAIPVGAATGSFCDVTVDDPIADRIMRPWFAGHGTHVLGLVGARHDNADTSKGACPHCGVQPMRTSLEVCRASRVTSTTNGSANAAAIFYLIDHGIQIVNMSFANNIPTFPTYFCQQDPNNSTCRAIKHAGNNGVVLVAASGNNRTRIAYPARSPGVVPVGGVDEQLSFWDNDSDPPPSNLDGCPSPGSSIECGSNWTTINGDPKQEVVVPSRQIDSTFYRGQNWNVASDCGDGVLGTLGDGHGPCTGTSMSSPIAAGIFGLLRSVNPLLLPGDPNGSAFEPLGVRNILAATTNQAQLGLPWDAKLGFGITDADAAVRGVLGTVAGQVVKNRVTPMFTLYGNTATDFAYSATPQGATALILAANGQYLSSGGSTPGYFDLPHDPILVSFLDPGATFYVMSTEIKPAPTAPELIPLFLLERIQNWPVGCVGGAGCNINNRDVTLATTETDVETMVADGYRYFHRQGFIYAPCAQEPSCIPAGAERLYRKCNATEDDCAVFLERDRSFKESQGYTQTYPAGGNVVLGYAYPNVDTDGDLLVDGMEYVIGTNPQLPDSDGDGQSDGAEFPQAGVPVSDPCQGPNNQCANAPMFANGFE